MASYGQQQQQQQWYAGGPAAGAAGAYAAPVGMTGITPGSNYYGQGMTGGTSMSGGGGDVGVGQWGGSMDSVGVEEDYSMEPPLLEELGINFRHIGEKTKTVFMPMRSMDEHIMDDADLAGPLFFLLCFGIFLLLTGKVHFGYIYGFGVSGCLAMYLVLNLLSVKEIDIWRVCSILGYGLLPVIVLSFLGIAVSLKGPVGQGIATFTIAWSTYSSTRLFEKALNMSQQRYLVAYPVALVYAIFVLITVF
ncbi:yip1 domain-containing protein [Nannochloropsis oceanica]